MKSTVLIFILSLYGILFSGEAKANFGFGPCCPPSMCGIIPCDSGCAGRAINQMGTNVSNAINSLNQSYSNLSQATQEAVDSMVNIGTDISQALTDQNNSIVNGFSASTNKIELALLQRGKTIERNSDFAARSIANLLKEVEVARASSDNISIFGDMSHPLSGDIGVNQASAMKKLYTQQKQIRLESVNYFNSYLNDGNDTSKGAGSGYHTLNVLKLLDNFDRVERAINSNVVSEEDFGSLQQLLALLVSSYPLPSAELPSETEYELDRKRYIAQLNVIYNGLLSATISKSGLDDAQWAAYYLDLDESSEGMVSMRSTLKGDIEGRLSNSEWWGAVRRLNETGLKRELAYQNGLSLLLEKQLTNLNKSSNSVTSIHASSILKASSNELRQQNKSL